MCRDEFTPDEFQEEVIKYDNFEKPLLVEAGPGSGKTVVIVERIKFLLENIENIDPSTILVMTFSRKASKELVDRLNDELNEVADKIHVSTIHSFCLDFLKGRDKVFELMDDDSGEKLRLFIQKHKEEDLGFEGIYHLSNYQANSVLKKFQEYTNFCVKSEELENYVEKEYPISQEYINFVNSLDYFSSKRVKDAGFKDDWYNARFQQTVRAYPKYLKLLDDKKAVDYNTLQLKTYDELEKNNITNFKHILIDEFQDTDPLQMRIFEKLLENAETFIAVGDMDQRIYSFRSSFNDYFEKFNKDYGAEILSLNKNHRSCDNIIEASDSFIEHQRKAYSEKRLEGENKDYNNPCFVINNKTSDEEAWDIINTHPSFTRFTREETKLKKIPDAKSLNNSILEAKKVFNLIQDLKNNGKIENYNEVAVLYRKHNTKSLPHLFELFSENNIPFEVYGQSNLEERAEIKSLVTLLWYITRKLDHSYIASDDELKWLNFKAFCGVDFEPTFWSLTDETKEYLLKSQKEFETKILAEENQVREKNNKKGKDGKTNRGKVTAYYNVKNNEDEDDLIEIFSKVDKPIVDLDKIADEDDKEFFINLNRIRDSLFDEESDLDIFDIFYELLSISNHFDDVDENIDELMNFALLSNTVSNYDSIMIGNNKNTLYYDLKGLYYFLVSMTREHKSSHFEENGVKFMTVHQTKGLEFPVTILLALEEGKFPSPAKDPQREQRSSNFIDNFYTPNEYLEYKDLTIDEENEKEFEEEERIIYVAMTRAKDLLVLSCLGDYPECIDNISSKLIEYDSKYLENITIKRPKKDPREEKIDLSYSKYNNYKICPFRYNLVNNLHFKSSEFKTSLIGTLVHRILNEINLELMSYQDISEEKAEEITKNAFSNTFEIDVDDEEFEEKIDSILDEIVEDLKYEEILDDILDYLDDFGLNVKVLGTEVPFSIERDDYNLSGAIDLIYQKEDGTVGILDYKFTESNHAKFQNYEEQLNIYASALKDSPDYSHLTISEARIYAFRSASHISASIDEKSINNQENELSDVASDIKKGIYDKKESGFCKVCEFRFVCGMGDE